MKGNDRIIFAIGVAAFALLAYSIFPEIGLTFDSDLYLKLSENLSSKGFDQTSFGSKPPLFPIVLWLLQNDLLFISLFNIVCWSISSILIYNVFLVKIEEEYSRLSSTLVLFFSTPTFMVHNFVWTEPLFIVLILSFFFQIQKKPTLKTFIITSAVLIGVVSLKHLGIALVMGFVLVDFWNEKSIKRSLIVFLPSLLFFIFWQFHSYQIRGDFSRLDHTESLNLIQNMDWIGNALWHWITPFELPTLFSVLFLLLILCVLVIRTVKAKNQERSWLIVPITLLVVISVKGDLLQSDIERYFAVAYIPMIYFPFQWLSKSEMSKSWIVKVPVLLFVVYSIIRTTKNGIFWH